MRKYLLLSLLLLNSLFANAQLSTNGLYFDGTGDLVRIPDNPAFNFGTGPFTVEAWVRDDDPLSVANTNCPIISNRTDTGTGGYMLTILGGNLTFFIGAGGVGVSNIDFRGGACHHVAVTGPDINGSFLCYVDGIYSGSGFGSNAGSGDVYIGNSPDFDGLPFSFHGLIKEVRLWNTIRTQSQIQTNMNAVLSGAANPSLVGYWRGNDVGSQTITDYSNQQNHGTLGLSPGAESIDAIPSTGCPSCTLPTGSITAGGALTFCTGSSVTFTVTTGTGLTYLWKKNGATIPGATGSTYAATTSGNYLCVISNSCGSIASNVLTVTVQTVPAITISASPNSTVICPGGYVTLLASATPGSTFQWKLNGTAIGGATNGYYHATVAGNYTCTATNPCGNALSNTKTVTTGTPPPATLTAAGPTTFCNGKSVVLSTNTGTNYVYSWRRDGNTISSAQTSSYTATQTGNYQVVVSIASSGCSTTSSGILVTVTPSTTPANVTPPGPIVNCGVGNVVLNANTGTGLTYKWKDFVGSYIPGATSSSYTVTTNGSFTVDITNSSGCVSTSASVLVTLASPFAGIGASGSTTFCSGGGVWLSTSWLPIPMTYQWKLNGTPIAGATNVSHYATVGGSYTAVVTNGCGSTTTSPLVVTVISAVPATPGTITTTGGAAKVCPGDVRTYSIATVSGATSYTWTPCAGSTIISGQNTNSVNIQYNSNFPTSDSLRVVANNGCGGSSAQRKIKISRNTPGTPSAITGTNYGVCNLSSIPYSVTNVGGMTYGWSFSTGTANVASGQGTSAITANYGAGFISASMSVTATNGCGTSAARVKTIYAKPATPASITGSTGVCLNQQDVPYSITPLSNVTNYTWAGPTGSHVSDGITTSGGTTLVTTATAVTVDFATTAGSVKVRGNNACASGSYKTLAVAIVCREGNTSPEFSETHIFPNPATTNFTLETDDTTPFDLEIYDALGRLVFSEINLNSGYSVDANGWADGLYSVVVHNGNIKTTLRLVIQATE